MYECSDDMMAVNWGPGSICMHDGRPNSVSRVWEEAPDLRVEAYELSILR